MQNKQKEFAKSKPKCTTEGRKKLQIIQLSECSRKSGKSSVESNKMAERHQTTFNGNYNETEVNASKQNYPKPAMTYVEVEEQTSPIRKSQRAPLRIITKKINKYYHTRQEKRMSAYLVEWDDRTRTWETVQSINSCYPMIAEFEISRNLSREMRRFADVNQQNNDNCRISIDDNAEYGNGFQIAINEDQLNTKPKTHSQHKSRHRNKQNDFKVNSNVANELEKKSAAKFIKKVQNNIYNCGVDKEEQENDGDRKSKTKKYCHRVKQQQNIKINEIHLETEHRIEYSHQNEVSETQQLVRMESQNAKSSKNSGQSAKLIQCIELQADDSSSKEMQHHSAESNQNAEPSQQRVESELLSSDSNQCPFIMNFEDLNMPLFPQPENEAQLSNNASNFANDNVDETDNKQQRSNVIVIENNEKNEENDSQNAIEGGKEGTEQPNRVQEKKDAKLTSNIKQFSKIQLSSRISKVMKKFSFQNMIKPTILQTAQTCLPLMRML